MSFYRIYRPQIISELDNQRVRDTITSFLKKKKEDLPHAFLLTGPKGAGKTTTARIIAKLFNCTKSGKNGPCGKCDMCQSIAQGTNMDVLEIDAASNRGIDDIRQLRERIALSPSASSYKVYIIDEVHMLTSEAFNALLKTLEEPPIHAVFILATTDPQKVPVTVRSRCVIVSFEKASTKELVGALLRIAKKESMDIEKDALTLIADMAEGAFRDAVKLLEQASFLEGKITVDAVSTTLAKSFEGKRKAFLISVLEHHDARKAFDQINEFTNAGTDMKTFVADCLSDLQGKLVDAVQKSEFSEIHEIQRLITVFTDAFEQMRVCPIAELPLQVAVVFYCGQHKGKSIQKTDESSAGRQISEKEQKPSVESKSEQETVSVSQEDQDDLLTLEKLQKHWADVIESLKPFNHSVAGVMRSARPKTVKNGMVTIEAFYKFHQERLSEPKVRDILCSVLKKLFGATVQVEIVLGRK